MPHISPKRRKPVERYSMTLLPDKQDKVLRIQARGGDAFGTQSFLSSASRGEWQWREAQKDENGLWTVWQFTSKHDVAYETGGKRIFSPERVLEQVQRFSEACFFDALHDCAAFEVGEFSRGMAVAEPKIPDEPVKHYRDFSKDEGIVFDKKTHMPIAVADGMVLSEKCTLDQGARAIVKKAKGNLLPATTQMPLQLGDILGNHDTALSVLPGSSTDQALAKMDQSVVRATVRADSYAAVEKFYAKRQKNLGRLSGSFKLAAKTKYQGVVLKGTEKAADDPFISSMLIHGAAGGAAVGFMLPPGVLSVVFYAVSGMVGIVSGAVLSSMWFDGIKTPVEVFRENRFVIPHRQFRKDLSRVRRQIKALPDGDQKNLSEEFLKRAEVTFYALSTRHAFKKAAAGSLWAKANMKWERRSLLRVARKHGMEESAITALLSALQDNPHASAFEDKLEGQFKKDVESFQSLLEQSEKNDVAQLNERLLGQTGQTLKRIAP